MFELVESSQLKYYQIEEFVEAGLVKHAFSTRLGGVSEEDFATLNLGFHTGDKAEKVIENRRMFCKELGIDYRNLVAGEQVHGDAIKIVTKQERGKGALDQQSAIAATDALITAQPGVALSSYYADCVPIIILDPVQKVVALAHGGWKGTFKRIAQQTVLKMVEEFNSPIEEVMVGIGPSIGPCCYEVDQQVIKPLQKAFSYWEELVEEKGEGKWNLNLWRTNAAQLKELGLLEKKIIVSEICTACNTDHLYSYRAEGGRTGRMASLIQLLN